MSDPAITRRNRANKRAGARFEIEVLNYCKTHTSSAHRWERIAHAGRNDQGDIAAFMDWGAVVFEAKNEKTIALPKYMHELEVERGNFATARGYDLANVDGYAVVKRRGAPIGQSYVVQTLDQLLRRAQ